MPDKKHPLIDKNTAAIVFRRMLNSDVVNLTTISSDGDWILGLNHITNLEEMCQIAEDNGLSCVPECLVKRRMK